MTSQQDRPPFLPPPPFARVAALAAFAMALAGCGGDEELEPGVTVELEPAQGQILVREPGERTFVTLDGAIEVPVGTEVDASKGLVRLTSATADGDTQTGDFSEGEFEVAQRQGSSAVTLSLRGGDFSPCRTRAARRDRSTVGGPEIRRLFADAEGDFRTRGRFAAATIRGTEWRTVDACFGTLTDVALGEVTVTDFLQRREVDLSAGEDLWVAQRP